MQLQYLDFEFSDEDSGHGSFDAMASVLPARLPPLLAEMEAVLRWAQDAFGPAAASHGEGEWDCELQALAEPDAALAVRFDARSGAVELDPAAARAGRVTLTLTIGGSRAFCEALRERFELDA